MTWPRLTPLRITFLLFILLSVLRFSKWTYLEQLDSRLMDYRLLERGKGVIAPDVVIVAIDDTSIDKLGRWPWSRLTIAQLVDWLSEAGAAVIGFDVVQSEPTADGASDRLRERLQGTLEGMDDPARAAVRKALEAGRSDDDVLADAVKRSGRTVLGYFFPVKGVAPSEGIPRISTFQLVQSPPGAHEQKAVHTFEAITPNLPAIGAAAREVGFFNFFVERDGYYRRAPLAIRFREQYALPLSLAMLRVYRPEAALGLKLDDVGVDSVRVGSTTVPVEGDGQLLVNYRGGGRLFPHVSAADVLAGEVSPDVVRGKMVLVGVTAVGVLDIRPTPFDGSFPGVEIHANILDNILRRDFIWRPSYPRLIDAGLMVLCLVVLGVGLRYARGVIGALMALGVLAAYLLVSQWAFVSQGAMLTVLYPVLAIAINYGAISVQHYVVEEREKRKMRSALELYLSPSIAALVSERPDRLQLGGAKLDLTVLFSDIRGFTTISERLDPEGLVEMLNVYLGEMTDVVFAHDGMLDKYIGDAIVAVWGAPLPQVDHATRACLTALEMSARLRALDDEWRRRGWPPFQIGIGLNTGDMVFGNMGSAKHLSLTVIGDNVNLGSRLEGLTKFYHCGIVASEATVHAAGGAIVSREIDLVQVKGKTLPVRIFEVLALHDDREQWAALVDQFHAGLRAYRERRWDDATARFTALLRDHPDDGPAALYLERCQEMRDHPPPPEWEGVTVMDVK